MLVKRKRYPPGILGDSRATHMFAKIRCSREHMSIPMSNAVRYPQAHTLNNPTYDDVRADADDGA